MTNPEAYTLILEPTGRWSAPPVVRLRRLLKAALRCFGFRAVRIVPADAAGPRETPANGGGEPDDG